MSKLTDKCNKREQNNVKFCIGKIFYIEVTI